MGKTHDTIRVNMTSTQPSVSSYAMTWATLLFLLVANILASRLRLGSWNLVIALGIALTQALLVLLVFMHVRYSKHETIVVACAAYLWLAILIVGTLHDYLTRNWIPGALGSP